MLTTEVRVEDQLIKLAGSVVKPLRIQDADRDDCFQIAYLAALQDVRALEKTSKPISWRFIVRAMKRAVFMHLKSIGVRAAVTDALADDIASPTDNDEGDGLQRIKDSTNYVLRELLATLPDDMRSMVEAIHLRGESIESVAASSGLSRRAIELRLAKAIEQMRQTATDRGITQLQEWQACYEGGG